MKKEEQHKEITRKEALKKMGKYAALTAVGTFAVLNPLRAQSTSLPPDPEAEATARTSSSTTTEEVTIQSATLRTQVPTNQVQNNISN